jgi:hypothetical protein
MRQRCNDPNYHGYRLYGGRGIKVCERWNDFNVFIADIGPRPSTKHSIERIDNNGNYEPGNCKWALIQEQVVNKRTNRLLTVGGVTMAISQWAEATKIKHSTILQRINRGWNHTDAVTIPPLHNDYHFIKKPRRCLR